MPVNLFLPQVTRVPITGPAPYNTLVCVSAESYLGPQELREGKLSRFPVRVATPFRLAGFDQRVAPTFDHSTTAWISSTGPIEDGNWVYAVDSVTGAAFTSNDGTYYLDLMAASSPDGSAPGTCMAFAEGVGICFYFIRISVTSWVLCYEPPIAPPPPQGHGHRLNDVVRQGISLADLARTPARSPGGTSTQSPQRTAAAEHIRRVLQQFAIPVSLSVSEPGNQSSGGSRRCDCTDSGCPTCGRGGGGGTVYRDGTGSASTILSNPKKRRGGR
jgi:hypothetical protein